MARVQGDSHTGGSAWRWARVCYRIAFYTHALQPCHARKPPGYLDKKNSLLVASLNLLGRKDHHLWSWRRRLVLGECSPFQEILNLPDCFSGIRLAVMTSTPDLAHQDVVLCHPDAPFPHVRLRLLRRTIMRAASAECLRRLSRRLGPTRSTPGGGLGIGATSLRNRWLAHCCPEQAATGLSQFEAKRLRRDPSRKTLALVGTCGGEQATRYLIQMRVC